MIQRESRSRRDDAGTDRVTQGNNRSAGSGESWEPTWGRMRRRSLSWVTTVAWLGLVVLLGSSNVQVVAAEGSIGELN